MSARTCKAARAAGADVVIVFPHWGTEYKSKPFAAQQKLARMIIDAGADMVIGNHAHWAAAMEVYKGRPIWYALGNFVFDQTWSEPTMEGITLELTFRGATLAQVRIRPHIILDKAQPNFLDPAGDGKVVTGPGLLGVEGTAALVSGRQPRRRHGSRRSPANRSDSGSLSRPGTRGGCRPPCPSRRASPRGPSA